MGVESVRLQCSMSWCEGSRDDVKSGPTEQNAPGTMLGNAEDMLNAEITKRAEKGSGQVVEVGIVSHEYPKRWNSRLRPGTYPL